MKTALLIIGLLLVKCVGAQQEKHLEAQFRAWQKEQLKNRIFWAGDTCNPIWFYDNDYYEKVTGVQLGFPDQPEIHAVIGDLNDDGSIDRLTWFYPVQCDGGNAAAWMQYVVVTLSHAGAYSTQEIALYELFENPFPDSSGFVLLDTASGNCVRGTYYHFLSDDAYCCPSVVIPVEWDLQTQEVVHIGANAANKEEEEH